MDYSFEESEVAHGDRLNNFHFVRQRRRAILEKLNNVSYDEVPYYLREMSLEDLYIEAAVVLDGKILRPARTQPGVYLSALGGKLFASSGGNDKTRIRTAQDKSPSSRISHPYYENNGIDISARDRALIEQAFELLCEGKGYTFAGDFLSEGGLSSASGAAWNKDTARTFFQNPIHAGYYQSFDKKHGQADKRGNIHMHKASFNGKPVVSYDIWLRANAVLNTRKIIFE